MIPLISVSENIMTVIIGEEKATFKLSDLGLEKSGTQKVSKQEISNFEKACGINNVININDSNTIREAQQSDTLKDILIQNMMTMPGDDKKSAISAFGSTIMRNPYEMDDETGLQRLAINIDVDSEQNSEENSSKIIDLVKYEQPNYRKIKNDSEKITPSPQEFIKGVIQQAENSGLKFIDLNDLVEQQNKIKKINKKKIKSKKK